MRLFFGLFLCFFFITTFSQNIKVSGNITDKNTGETLIGDPLYMGREWVLVLILKETFLFY